MMMFASLLLMVMMGITTATAVVEDHDHVLTPEETEMLTAVTPDELCVSITQRGTLQTVMEVFKKQQEDRKKGCAVLVAYARDTNKIRVVQSAEPGEQRLLDDDVKKALLVFDEVKQEQHAPVNALAAAVENLAASLTQTPRNALCGTLKDGVCEKNCVGPDLDCLCGNGVCEYFEQETCATDCRQKEWLCAVITDGSCDKSGTCLVTDLDCRLAALRDRMEKARVSIGIPTGTLIALLAVLVMALSIAVIVMLHRKMKLQENKKGVSFIPSKMFTFLFTVVVLTIGMFLFLMIGERTAEAETTAVPGATYGVAVYRILNSPQCFVHADPHTDLPDAGLIEVSRFTQHQLDDCFMIPPDAAEKECLKLELYGYRLGEKKIITEIQTTNFAQCATVHRLQKQPYPVRLFDKGEIQPGLLIITAKKGD